MFNTDARCHDPLRVPLVSLSNPSPVLKSSGHCLLSQFSYHCSKVSLLMSTENSPNTHDPLKHSRGPRAKVGEQQIRVR